LYCVELIDVAVAREQWLAIAQLTHDAPVASHGMRALSQNLEKHTRVLPFLDDAVSVAQAMSLEGVPHKLLTLKTVHALSTCGELMLA
jgi:hypothetical protein